MTIGDVQDICRFLFMVTIWFFIWSHVPGRTMGWRLIRAGLILASMLWILWLRSVGIMI